MEAKTVFEWNQILRNKAIRISFRKADGTDTTKFATLREEYLPEPRNETDEGDRELSSTNVTFWSVEDNGWRSFRVDSVNSYVELIG